MKVLLDTNIVVYREASVTPNSEIGTLFLWLDKLNYHKCVHPVTLSEIARLKPGPTLDAMSVKLGAYDALKVRNELDQTVAGTCSPLDNTENSRNDTRLINELYIGSVEALITEDRGIHRKADRLGIPERVFTVEAFLDKVRAENPTFIDYRVLSIRREYFGEIDHNDTFFDSLRVDYPGFDSWFKSKSQESAYVCRKDGNICAFLYLKIEAVTETYADIERVLRPLKRLKIGTFKVAMNGFKLGERFLKIAFDNALQSKVGEIYVTMLDESLEKRMLDGLLKDFGFEFHGAKRGKSTTERVLVRDMTKSLNVDAPAKTYPYFDTSRPTFIVPIYPAYHTSLFPDSILRNESPTDFVEQEPFRNAIHKVYISRSILRNLNPGDNVVFYRTGGKYAGVVTTIGVVEAIVTNISTSDDFIRLCRKRSVFTDKELLEQWNYGNIRPFIVNFLYSYSLPRRPNLARLIELGVIADVMSAPRGFEQISEEQFRLILQEGEADGSFIVN